MTMAILSKQASSKQIKDRPELKVVGTAKAKPFIKWVGGKRQILPELLKRLPSDTDTYIEPFVGGGALLWSIDRTQFKDVTINDYNEELTNLYSVIKNEPEKLIASLERHRNTEKYYYKIREMDRTRSYNRRTPITKASRFIYLNRTGFNGLYRVNRLGQNNVPYGRYANPKIVDRENILLCSRFLQDVTITTGDFESIKRKLTQTTLVYLDPPYIPLSETANFTSYTDQGFDMDMQFRLREMCDYIDAKGAKFMLSNSASPLIYDLYKGYHIETVLAGRSINCKGAGRGKIKEVIIRNYGSVQS